MRILSLLLLTSLANASTIATTEDGRKVTLDDNGTWTFVQETPSTPSSSDGTGVDCSTVLSTTSDRVTGKSLTAMKEPVLMSNDNGKTGIALTLMQGDGGVVIMTMIAAGDGASSCVDEGDKVNVLLRDGRRLELASDNDFNCSGKSTIYFGGPFGKKAQLSEIASGDIDVLRVWTHDGYVERELDASQSKNVRLAFACLAK